MNRQACSHRSHTFKPILNKINVSNQRAIKTKTHQRYKTWRVHSNSAVLPVTHRIKRICFVLLYECACVSITPLNSSFTVSRRNNHNPQQIINLSLYVCFTPHSPFAALYHESIHNIPALHLLNRPNHHCSLRTTAYRTNSGRARAKAVKDTVQRALRCWCNGSTHALLP